VLTGATATASQPGEGAPLAVDGTASTRWSSGTAQAPGQYPQVDLGRTRTFRRVAVDSGGNVGDYARAWKLSVSRDGTTWKTAAGGIGIGQLTNVDLRPTRARYLRVTSTGSDGSWWSVADLPLYR
jgi:glucosylceramidase